MWNPFHISNDYDTSGETCATEGLIDLLKKTQTPSFTWLGNNEQEEYIFDSSLRLDLPYVNVSELTTEEKVFLETTLHQSFCKAFNQLGFPVVSSAFARKHDDERDEGRDNGNYSYRDKWSECMSDLFCGIEAKRMLSDDTLSRVDDYAGETCEVLGFDTLSHPLQLRHTFRLINKNRHINGNDSGIMQLWEDEFLKSLREGKFHKLSKVEECVITFEDVQVIDQSSEEDSSSSSKLFVERNEIEQRRDELVKTLLKPRPGSLWNRVRLQVRGSRTA